MPGSAAKLPERFLASLHRQLDDSGMGGEWEAFVDSFSAPAVTGIRGNLLKGLDRPRMAELLDAMGLDGCDPVPWSASGFVLPPGLPPSSAPGRHPFHHAGLFYLQEPSAMLPAEALDARPGERVMDLCAAPGGKSTRIAESMQGKGLLFCNDIHPDRARVLIRNLELHGVTNAVVLNESPGRIADRFPGGFDRVLVDAPCSGEGMFRRDGRAVSGWDRFGPARCTVMQDDILHEADRLLRSGGVLVYSTCTFSHEEDEGSVARFMASHPGYEVLPHPAAAGMSPGISLPGGLSPADAARTARIWPHRAVGEGHFCAVLRKGGHPGQEETRVSGTASSADPVGALESAGVRLTETGRLRLDAAGAWSKAGTSRADSGAAGDRHIHWLPETPPVLDGLRVLKQGLYIGTWRHGTKAMRFEPSHSWLLTMRRDEMDGCLDLEPGDERILRYLRGETVALDPSDRIPTGPVPVFIGRHPLGWGRNEGRGSLKNGYPPSWRRLT